MHSSRILSILLLTAVTSVYVADMAAMEGKSKQTRRKQAGAKIAPKPTLSPASDEKRIEAPVESPVAAATIEETAVVEDVASSAEVVTTAAATGEEKQAPVSVETKIATLLGKALKTLIGEKPSAPYVGQYEKACRSESTVWSLLRDNNSKLSGVDFENPFNRTVEAYSTGLHERIVYSSVKRDGKEFTIEGLKSIIDLQLPRMQSLDEIMKLADQRGALSTTLNESSKALVEQTFEAFNEVQEEYTRLLNESSIAELHAKNNEQVKQIRTIKAARKLIHSKRLAENISDESGDERYDYTENQLKHAHNESVRALANIVKIFAQTEQEQPDQD